MAKFLVPPSCHPGLFRLGGFIKSGDTCFLEDLDDCLSLKLIPLDADAYAALVSKFGIEKVKATHGDEPAKDVAPVVEDDRKTLRQMAEDAAVIKPPVHQPKKTTRHSDR